MDDAGYPLAPESDLQGAISSILLESASASGEPSFLPDITIRHPANDNAVLLWHADAPLSLRASDSSVKLDLPWILKGLPTGLVHFRLKDGPLTLCRFAGAGNDYRLGCGEGHTIPGPYTQEFYAWMEVDNWPTWERQLIEGPYIDHCSCCYGLCADVLEEAVRYLPQLEIRAFRRATRRALTMPMKRLLPLQPSPHPGVCGGCSCSTDPSQPRSSRIPAYFTQAFRREWACVQFRDRP